MSGNVYATSKYDNQVDNSNNNDNVNPLTGTKEFFQNIASNITAFSNASTPIDVQTDLSNATSSSGMGNNTSVNQTSGATSGYNIEPVTNTTTNMQ